jgi:hypothetical protein
MGYLKFSQLKIKAGSPLISAKFTASAVFSSMFSARFAFSAYF